MPESHHLSAASARACAPALTQIAAGQQARVEQLQALCAINSGSWHTAGLARMREALVPLFAPFADSVEVRALAPVQQLTRSGERQAKALGELIVLRKRIEAPIQVLLVGHYDTVFGAEHPFQGGRLLDANTLNAPGAADLKGGLLVLQATLAAFEALPADALPGRDQLGWTVLLNPDEEIGSPGSAPALAEFAAQADVGFCYEPSLPSGELAGARKGSGTFTVHVRGRAAHAGREHHLGRNAIVAMAGIVARLEALNGRHGDLTVNVGLIDGGGAVNVVPDTCLMKVNARVSDHAQAQIFEAELRAAAAEVSARDGYTVSIDGSFHRPAKPMTPAFHTLLEAVARCGQQLGLTLRWNATGGCCDGNNLAAAGLANVDTLGVRGGNIHSADEFCLLDSMTERAQLSLLLLAGLASGEIALPARAERTGT